MHRKLIPLMLAVAVLGFTLEQAYAALPAPVAHWSFDGSGLDSSGNHNDAKLFGKISYVPGLYGAAAQFHGQGDYFQVANNPAMQLRSTQQFSVAAYVQPSTLDEQIILFHGFGSVSLASWFLGVQGGDPDATLYPASRTFVFGTRSSNGSAYTGATGKAVAGGWTHLAATYDGTTLKLYIDGVLQSSVAAPLPYNSTQSLYLGGNPGDALAWYVGLLDDVYIFDQALTDDEIQAVTQGPVEPQLAQGAHPANRAIDVPRDTTLRWTAGQFAATHDVYLGETFADVNDASRTKPGVCLVSRGQTGTTYTPAAIFEFGRTYYWRVDEVNQTPSGTILKGRVWSFPVEPYSYPIAGTSITATASSTQPYRSPERTIDGSGLVGDLHGTDYRTMWLSSGWPLPDWIQYEFDKVYKLDKMLVWNQNDTIEAWAVVSLDAKDVTVGCSVDGAKWTALANVPQFARATGRPDYAPNTTVNFGGAMARYVKLTINSTWAVPGWSMGSGLSEVRFYYAPAQARAPQPTAGATGQSLTTMLSWRPGRDMTSHQVYFGTDPNAVANGTVTAKTVTDHTFDPGALLYGTTYYWRVDGIDAAGIYRGEVWSFTTQEFSPVDDFESYNDTNHRLRDTWIDGLTDGKSGSVVGYLTAPSAEQTIVHGGTQSMPLAYDNRKTPFYSETTRDLGTPQDWTGHGATHLDLWFRGYPATGMTTPTNAPASLYLTVVDNVGKSGTVVHPNPSATNVADWTEWRIPLGDLMAAGIQMTQVQKITLGVGAKSSPKAGGTGMLYLDDLGLGHPVDAPIQARAPQPADGATGQSVTTTLRWQSDRAGASHKVFFGTNWDAVAYGTAAAQTVTDPAFDPGPLTYGTTYYWRVDEVSTVTCPGEVWSFTIREFTVVDDFESYNNTDNRIYDTWIDGLADGKSGSAVGYMTAPFAEQKIVHGGHQSMPLSYDNTKAPFSSETTRDLGVPQDWTGHGATHLDLWFKGSPGGPGTPFNYPSSLYLTVTDKAGKSKTVSNPMNPVAVQMVDWTEWRIRLSDLTGVSLTTVQKITLRVSSMVTSKAGGAGLLYFDDIGFGHPVK